MIIHNILLNLTMGIQLNSVIFKLYVIPVQIIYPKLDSSTKCLILTCAMITSKYFVTFKYKFAFHLEEFYFSVVMGFQVPRRIWERPVCFFFVI
jgi:hypothetical protein